MLHSLPESDIVDRLLRIKTSLAPNDGFLLNKSKPFLGCSEYFYSSRNAFREWRYKICIYLVILGKRESQF